MRDRVVWKVRSIALPLLFTVAAAPPSPRSEREAAYQQTRTRALNGAGSTRRGPQDADAPRLDELARRVGGRPLAIEGREDLKRFFSELDRLDERLANLERLDLEIAGLETELRQGLRLDENTLAKHRLHRERLALESTAAERAVRILHLGDSHIAADYITKTVRSVLQARFGDGGRGFVMADQKSIYGGRRLEKRGWDRVRIADADGAGRALGVAGMVLISSRVGAEVFYELGPEDRQVVIHHLAHPEGPKLQVWADDLKVADWPTRAEFSETRALRIDVDLPPPKPTRLQIQTDGADAEVHAVSFETGRPGLLYDAVGPVGADADVWLRTERQSFIEGAQALAPSLIVLMIGGNDALALRQERRRPTEVAEQLQRLIQRLRVAAPEADCLLFSPMDAAEGTPGGGYTSKPMIREVVALMAEAAAAGRCAFWNAFEAMGGEGSFGRWLRAGLMNEDLVHPRRRGGKLLGHLFASALMDAYLTTED